MNRIDNLQWLVNEAKKYKQPKFDVKKEKLSFVVKLFLSIRNKITGESITIDELLHTVHGCQKFMKEIDFYSDSANSFVHRKIERCAICGKVISRYIDVYEGGQWDLKKYNSADEYKKSDEYKKAHGIKYRG